MGRYPILSLLLEPRREALGLAAGQRAAEFWEMGRLVNRFLTMIGEL
jgi:hypothetical protein